jgi:hypothetical protein
MERRMERNLVTEAKLVHANHNKTANLSMEEGL